MRTRQYGFVLLFLCLVVADNSDAASGWKINEISSPAGPGSGEPSLAYSNGQVIASWLEPQSAGGHALRFARWNGSKWSPASTISSGSSFFVNWADFPSVIELSDRTMVAHWLEKKGKSTYAYHVMISVSKDQGKTWSKPISPHRDASETEHGFVSLLDQGKGSFSAVWLDGRNMKSSHSAAGSTQVMYSKFENGAFGAETTLDPKVCDCCQTDAVAIGKTIVVVYRDRSDAEVRDISLVRLQDNKWTPPKTIHRDQWKINGCPVNGPAVVADQKTVAVAWFTGAGDKGRVNVAFSSDRGSTFGTPVQVDEGKPTGRVDLLLLENGSALVSWLENTSGNGAEIRARVVSSNLKKEPSFVIADSTNARSSGFPRMVRAGKEILLAWTYATTPAKVRFARLIREQ